MHSSTSADIASRPTFGLVVPSQNDHPVAAQPVNPTPSAACAPPFPFVPFTEPLHGAAAPWSGQALSRRRRGPAPPLSNASAATSIRSLAKDELFRQTGEPFLSWSSLVLRHTAPLSLSRPTVNLGETGPLFATTVRAAMLTPSTDLMCTRRLPRLHPSAPLVSFLFSLV